jgi:tetratricopeptide (TPR) repeat protein
VPLGELPPPAPRDCFGRDGLIEKVVGLAENLQPIALIGAGGIGKTSIALKVLHHHRIKERFGENRRFIRCDQFPALRSHFLARLSEVLGAGVENPKDLTPLRPLLSSKDMLIILDNAESILDPKATGSREIYSVVDELCQFETICLCITSRITTIPPRCERPEIPTLSMEAACNIFYGIHRNVGRSSVINDLLERLDFHALSIKLLATTASHNGWDHDRLTKEWDARRAQVLQTDYNESLAATIELSLSSPTFLSLGPNTRDLLGVVAFLPQGVDEKNLDWLFHTISNRKNIFDKFCVLSLTYRSDGFLTMLAPIRDYLGPQDPQSSPLLSTIRDLYFNRLSVDIHPGHPGFEEARWIVSEDVNIEHLLDVFTSIDLTGADNWGACCHFIEHLYWHKQRQVILGSKIEVLADDHHSKPKCLFELSRLLERVGTRTEAKRLLVRTLELERQRGDDVRVARALRYLSDINRLLGFTKEGTSQAREALAISERVNDTEGQVEALIFLALLLQADNQLDAAENAALSAINLISEKDQGYAICSLHKVLGRICQSKGEKERAIHHFKTAIGIASPSNWRDELFQSHYGLADLFCAEYELDEASAHINQAKLLAVNNSHWLGGVMVLQACISYKQGRLENATSEAVQALEILEKLGDARDIGICRDVLQIIERAKETRTTGS